MNYVIVGNSAGGIAAIEAIRECDKKGRITVISEESGPCAREPGSYSKPLISYLLGGKTGIDEICYRGKDFYEKNEVEIILNKRVTKLNTDNKEVTLKGNRKIHFDKLLIAAGGVPIAPDIKGADSKGVFTFTGLDDARNIQDYIKAEKVKKAIVIGGGLIGLKAVEALMELNIKVVIIELADRILSSTFDKKASGIIQEALKKNGCELRTNNTVVEIKLQKQGIKCAILKDKEEIQCEMVIVAIGVIPNVELVKNTAVKVNRGILVDTFMQTNVKDIYAAGDCCEAKDLLLGIKRPVAIWPVAVREGKTAGCNMAGVKKEYQGSLAMNSVELCGIPTVSAGETNSEGKEYQILEFLEQKEFRHSNQHAVYKKIVLKNDRIVGVIFVGSIERAGIYIGLIKDKVDTTSFRESLLRDDFGLICLPRDYRKHLVVGEHAII